MASRFCHDAVPAAAPLAVLGVFSYESRRRLREGARRTWLPRVPSLVHARFVMRGESPANATTLEREIHTHGDIVLVRGPSRMHGNVAPLLSLIRWFECASQLYRNAPFFGSTPKRQSNVGGHAATCPTERLMTLLDFSLLRQNRTMTSGFELRL